MKHYFGHAEISETCITGRGVDGAWFEACRRLFDTYRQMVQGRMFKDDGQPKGKIILSVGWQPADSTEDKPLRPAD